MSHVSKHINIMEIPTFPKKKEIASETMIFKLL